MSAHARAARAHARETATEIAKAIVASLAVGATLGILEGSLYPQHGPPRLPLGSYWPWLVVALLLALVGLLVLMRAKSPASGALGALPLSVAAQDAPSRLLQGHTLASHPWEVSVFGDHVLARADLGMPGWYVAAALLALALLVAPHVRQSSSNRPGGLRKRAPRRRPRDPQAAGDDA